MQKNNSRYLVAKYVPDLTRMEPRNIGVVLWVNGKVQAKFLAPKNVDGLASESNYLRWVGFWENKLAVSPVIASDGDTVTISDSRFLDGIVSTQKDNYLLVEGGEFLTGKHQIDIDTALRQLYRDLVAPGGDKGKGAKPPSFQRICDGVVSTLGVDFKKKQPVSCHWRGVQQELHADYYFGNGRPDAILQRAKLSNEASISSAAFIVDALLEDQVVSSENCRFLVRWSDVVNKQAEQGLKLFEKLCGVVDVQDDEAIDQLEIVVGKPRENDE